MTPPENRASFGQPTGTSFSSGADFGGLTEERTHPPAAALLRDRPPQTSTASCARLGAGCSHASTTMTTANSKMKRHAPALPDGASATQPPSMIVGRFGHVLIGSLLESGVRTVDPKVIAQAVRALPLDEVPTVHPYAVAQQLSVTAAVYLRLFAPDVPWKLKHREHGAYGCRFDLVFSSPRGVFVDEIKTARLDGALERVALTEQVARELRAGARTWRSRFRGVRVVVLGAPRQSTFHAVDGTIEPVAWGAASDG